MKKLLALFLFCISVCFIGCTRAVRPDKDTVAFTMQEPKGWIRVDTEGLQANLGKFEFSEQAIEKIQKDQNVDVVLAAYYKYDPKTKEGIIPTIQIVSRPNRTRDFQSFKAGLLSSIDQLKRTFDQYELIEQPTEVEIGGIRSVFVHATFVLRNEEDREFRVRSRTYAAPRGSRFIQLNFTDHPEDEDCSAEFDALLKTIKVGS